MVALPKGYAIPNLTTTMNCPMLLKPRTFSAIAQCYRNLELWPLDSRFLLLLRMRPSHFEKEFEVSVTSFEVLVTMWISLPGIA
jgi:hypothetical protein